MKYKLKNKVYEIDLSSKLLIKDDVSKNFEILSQSDNSAKININGITQTVYFAAYKDDIFVSVDGRSYKFDKVDPEAEFSSNSVDLNRAEIMPPMPGSIIEIVAKKGDKVKEGDPLIIVEAMKMETTLYSPIDGKVTDVRVEEKEQISGDEALMIIEK